ncbi:carbohydrate ABC transporter permease [Labrys wisconsinensis]|uniref:Glucose/mannose transport system permease protein n=1 Tax=Labrys wisconsinensis TaxID=425677 RepID=A0ABU0JLJ2_9HYPH|nr:carbohydrate ABC transporter permease [Labrys wisconsinensis]MDQ0474238.1 glucose/mannose transport system permease protein [Labrys wisconsinensis]
MSASEITPPHPFGSKIAPQLRKAAIYAALIMLSAFYLMPVYMMVVNGMKTATEVSISTMWQLPGTLGLGGFREAWARLQSSFQNSLEITISATAISCLIGSLTGYILSLWRFKWANFVSILIIFGMFIPYQSIIVPLVFFTQKVGLYGTIPGLIVVHIIYGQSINALIFGNYYRSVPQSLIEAARVDGAGVWKVYWKIILPLSPPAFVVAAIFQFTNIWNDFLFGVTIVPNPQSQPITVALNNLSGNFSVDWNVVMAGAVIAALPTALVYVVLGRYFVRGLVSGSVKS